jgi:hypothetical protein
MAGKKKRIPRKKAGHARVKHKDDKVHSLEPLNTLLEKIANFTAQPQTQIVTGAELSSSTSSKEICKSASCADGFQAFANVHDRYYQAPGSKEEEEEPLAHTSSGTTRLHLSARFEHY